MVGLVWVWWCGCGSVDAARALRASGPPKEVSAEARPPGRCNDGVEDTAGGSSADCALSGTYRVDDADLAWVGEDNRAWCGSAVVGGVDLGGDGRPDVVVGCPGEAAGGVRGGVVHVFTGRLDRVDRPLGEEAPVVQGVEHADAARLVGGGPDGNFGLSLAAGEVDGDGQPDLVVGAPYDGEEAAGAVWWAPGPLAEGVVAAGAVWAGERRHGSLGKGVALSGMADGPVLAAEYGVFDPGRVHRFGAGDGAVETLHGRCDRAPGGCAREGLPGAETGRGLVAGDLDGDGVNEVVVGAPYDDAGGVDAGAVYVHRAGTGAVALVDERVLVGLGGFELGRAVEVADVDGDGANDLLAGAPGAGPDPDGVDAPGAVYLVPGPVGGAVTLADAPVLWGPEEGARFGSSLAWVGDVDADGAGDLLVGAPGEDLDEMALDAGVIWLRYGPFGVFDPWARSARFAGVPGANTGWTVAAAGDLNLDGHADLLFGVPGAASADGEPRGAAYLVYGRGG